MSGDVDLEPLARLRRGDVLDELSTEDGTVVLVGRTSGGVVVRLSPLGHEILAAVGEGCTVPELESELRSRLGEPDVGDPSSLVRSGVAALLEHGVLIVVRS
ncbi:MAG: hypothetical protein ACKOVB_04700 [Terrabacter sp.]